MLLSHYLRPIFAWDKGHLMLKTPSTPRRILCYVGLALGLLSLSLNTADAKKRKRGRFKFAKKGTITISGGGEYPESQEDASREG